MKRVHHINIKNDRGEVYCCLRNKVVPLDEEQLTSFCKGCSMFAGTAGGQGVECIWNDMRSIGSPCLITDPVSELKQNQTRQVRLRTVSPAM
ncbi:hypothetical protein [Paenibacillus gansuensis]|uniref:Uncharacterized protein n=1 Tax=Paenibacillus gansuensis TaxID=306542 RepID=A0ABW5PK45_9BACL